jgi:hypothetical protein
VAGICEYQPIPAEEDGETGFAFAKISGRKASVFEDR